jgi:hypothetical protein
MDEIGRKSGHLMLITPERVFYAGLLGRPRERCSGAFNMSRSKTGCGSRHQMAGNATPKWWPCCRTQGIPSPAIIVRC